MCHDDERKGRKDASTQDVDHRDVPSEEPDPRDDHVREFCYINRNVHFKVTDSVPTDVARRIIWMFVLRVPSVLNHVNVKDAPSVQIKFTSHVILLGLLYI